MKQQNPWRWKKTMAMLLALAMLACTPLGAAGAYALEGETPSGDIELILDESPPEDSGLPPVEEEAQPNVATPSAITSAAVHSNLVSDTGDMISGSNAEPATTAVCAIGAKEYLSLDAAMDDVPSGNDISATIRLLQSITQTSPVVIDGKMIVFELNGYDLTIDTRAIDYSTALKAINASSVSCTGNGKLNASGSRYGVYAYNYSQITVSGDVVATGGSTVTGPYPGTGAYSSGGGTTVTIDGSVTGDPFVEVSGNGKSANDYEATSSKPGYRQYGLSGFNENTVWVKEGSATVTKEPTPSTTFTATEVGSGKLASLQPDMRYSVDGGSSWLVSSGSSVIIYGVTASKGIQVKKLGNGTTTTDSDIQTITVTQAAIPTGLSKVNCTTAAQNDGKLIGLTTTMEYKLSNSVTWTGSTGGDIIGLVSGIYYVRVKATGTVLASENTELVIAPYGLTLIPVPTANNGLKWTGSVQIGVSGDTGYTLDGIYQATDVSVSGYNATATLQAGYAWDDGTTVVKNILWNIGKADGPAAPTGLAGVAPTTVGGSNGKITGTTTTMEYANNTGFANAADCFADETTGLVAGTYYVRVKSTVNHETGIYATITLQPASTTSTVTDVNGTGSGSYNPPSSGGGGSYTTSTPNITTEKKPNQPTEVSMNLAATVDKNGVAAITITEVQVRALIDEAKKDVESKGKTADGISIVFNIQFSADGKSVSVKLEEKALGLLEKEGMKRFDINTPLVSYSFDKTAIKEMKSQAMGTVTLAANPVIKLSDAAKALIGKWPVYDLTVSYRKNSKTAYITNFGKGTITLGIFYNATLGEKTGNLFGVYVGKNGKPQLLEKSSYDSGRVIFGRSNLSTCGIGYKAPAPAFTDTVKHWAKDNIDFVASRDLISGITAKTFAPDTAITREDFLMALGKLSGADVSGYKTSGFTDMQSANPALPYIEWAVKNGVVQGIGNSQFGPDRQITREQMAVMMVNYAKATGYQLPVSRQAITFADDAIISSWGKEAVKAIQQTGIMVGKNNSLFGPQDNATRAEASTILRRFVELVIDEGTARGWRRNDSGQWQYIDVDGRAATGWLTVDNAKYYFTSDGIMVSGKWLQLNDKWYYFYADGSLAKSTKVDGYDVDENGVKK